MACLVAFGIARQIKPRSCDHVVCAAARQRCCCVRACTGDGPRARHPAKIDSPSQKMFASIALKPLPVLPARKAASRGAACRATPVVRASLKAKVRLHAVRAAPRPPPKPVRTAGAAAGRRRAFDRPLQRNGSPQNQDLYALIAGAPRAGRGSARRLLRSRRQWCSRIGPRRACATRFYGRLAGLT